MTMTWGSASRWKTLIPLSLFCAVVYLMYSYFHNPIPSFGQNGSISNQPVQKIILRPSIKDGNFHWANVQHQYPVLSPSPVPSPDAKSIPRIQHQFWRESKEEFEIRSRRLDLVKGNFTHAWKGYKDHAWLKDEVAPISGDVHNHFGGWAATLVDSLDTLWIMDLHEEFEEAVDALSQIDFSTCALEELNVFETTIRYLGGFLGAYDISEGKYALLLLKAVELGDMLYKAFDTPNRMPVTRWKFRAARNGENQQASDGTLVSEIGSLTLEFTRLSQVTGEAKWFDAVQRIMDIFDEQQDKTKLPGMWPIVVDAKNLDFTSYGGFTIGGMADSLYEYLPKQHILLGAATQQYQRLYEKAMNPMGKHIFYRPMTKTGEDIRFAGNVNSDGQIPASELKTEPQAQHLGCFSGGMVAIGAKIFSIADDLSLAKKLTEGCLWGYETSPLGIMPEIIHTVPCDGDVVCAWNEEEWHHEIESRVEGGETVDEKIQKYSLRPGISKVDDKRYILRPEAIESVFILYRITGDRNLQDRAWGMFESIIKHTLTPIAHAGLDDCTRSDPPKSDRMESFWLAETLKYFYLIFAEPDLVSLDDFVLNTEAHPLRRPR